MPKIIFDRLQKKRQRVAPETLAVLNGKTAGRVATRFKGAADKETREVWYDDLYEQLAGWTHAKQGTILKGDLRRAATGPHSFTFSSDTKDDRTLQGEGAIYFDTPSVRLKAKITFWIEGEAVGMGPLPAVLDKADKLAEESMALIARHDDLVPPFEARISRKALENFREIVSQWRRGTWVDKPTVRSHTRMVLLRVEGKQQSTSAQSGRGSTLLGFFRDAFGWHDAKTKIIRALITACKKVIREVKGQ